MYGTTGSTLPGWLFSKGHPAVFILFEAPTSGADPGSAQCGIGTPGGNRVYLTVRT